MPYRSCPGCHEEVSDKVKICPHCSFKFKNTNNYIMKLSVLFIFILSLLLLIIVVITSYGKPYSMSQGTYQYGIEALTIVDQCIDGDIEAEIATSQLNDIESKLDSLYLIDYDTDTSLMSNYVSLANSSIILGNDIDILEYRNVLANYINKKKRN